MQLLSYEFELTACKQRWLRDADTVQTKENVRLYIDPEYKKILYNAQEYAVGPEADELLYTNLYWDPEQECSWDPFSPGNFVGFRIIEFKEMLKRYVLYRFKHDSILGCPEGEIDDWGNIEEAIATLLKEMCRKYTFKKNFKQGETIDLNKRTELGKIKDNVVHTLSLDECFINDFNPCQQWELINQSERAKWVFRILAENQREANKENKFKVTFYPHQH